MTQAPNGEGEEKNGRKYTATQQVVLRQSG